MSDNASEKTVLSKEDYILALEGEVERLKRHITDERSIYETKLSEAREDNLKKLAEIRRLSADISSVLDRSDVSTSVQNISHFSGEIRRISQVLSSSVYTGSISCKVADGDEPVERNPIPAGYVEMAEHIKRVEERLRTRDNELAACKAFLSTQGSLISDALQRSGGYYSLDDLVDSHLNASRRLVELDSKVSEMTDKVLALSDSKRETALEARIAELEELVSILQKKISERDDDVFNLSEEVEKYRGELSKTIKVRDALAARIPRTDPLAPDVAQTRISALVRNRINRESPGISTEARLAVCIINAVDQLSDVSRYFTSSGELSREGAALKAIELIGINIRSLFYSTTYPADVSRIKIGRGPRIFGYQSETEKLAGLRKAILKAAAFIAAAASIFEDVSGDQFDLFYDLANEEEGSDVWK